MCFHFNWSSRIVALYQRQLCLRWLRNVLGSAHLFIIYASALHAIYVQYLIMCSYLLYSGWGIRSRAERGSYNSRSYSAEPSRALAVINQFDGLNAWHEAAAHCLLAAGLYTFSYLFSRVLSGSHVATGQFKPRFSYEKKNNNIKKNRCFSLLCESH